MRWRKNNKRLTPDDIYPHRAQAGLFSGLAWELSVGLGKISFVILAVVVLLLLLGGAFDLRERAAAILPESVVSFFTRPSESQESKDLERLRSRVVKGVQQGTEAIRESAPRPRSATFTVGSTRDEVLRIQGRPTSMSGDVWYYGASRVYFSADRVVAWNSEPANPLQTR